MLAGDLSKVGVGTLFLLVLCAFQVSCGSDSNDFWKAAEPSSVTRVKVGTLSAGTSGEGGATVVAYATDTPIEDVVDKYVDYFSSRDIPSIAHEKDSASFDSPEAGVCMDIERWGDGVGFVSLRSQLSESEAAQMDAGTGSYFILVPDDCSYTG